MNHKTLADALAARFAPAAVTPPTGYKNITSSTAQPPNNIPNTPFVIAWPDHGEFTWIPGNLKGTHEYLVTFYYSKSEGDIVREYKALEEWLGILIAQIATASMLGLGGSGVLKAEPMRWEIGKSVFAGDTYEVITLTVDISTSETLVMAPA